MANLFIGMGGSGVKTIANLKDQLKSSDPELFNKTRFLLIDTDEKELLGKRMHELLNPPPVQREWVGLTLEDMQDLNASKDWIAGAKWAATLLWEKNNAKT